MSENQIMNQIIKNITKIILQISILVLFFTAFSLESNALVEASGEYGTCKWELEYDGTLEIYEGDFPEGGHLNEKGEFIQNPIIKSFKYKVKKIEFMGKVNANKNSSGLFADYNRLEEIKNIDYLNTSSVEDMSNMFLNSDKLTVLDVSNFDTSKVENMSHMFEGCTKLPMLDVSKFDTSNVKDMSYMFYDCGRITILDVSKFDTSNVKDMCAMFYGCESLTKLDVSNFDTSKVEDMSAMFESCSEITVLDVSNFDTSNVKCMSYMFDCCLEITKLDVSNFDTSNVENMSCMFEACTKLPMLDVSKFDTSKVEDMSIMFGGCESLTTLDVSKFNTLNVKNMSVMFAYCKSLTRLDVSKFDLRNIKSDNSRFSGIKMMFQQCEGLEELYLSSFDTMNLDSKEYGIMLYSLPNLKRIKLGEKTILKDNETCFETIPQNNEKYTGYWVDEKDQDGNTYEIGEDVLAYHNTKPETRTYIWQGQRVNIKFDPNGQTSKPYNEELHLRYGQKIDLSKAKKPERKNYNFAGWADSEEDAYKKIKTKLDGETIKFVNDRTLYAIWNKKSNPDLPDSNNSGGSSQMTVIVANGERYSDTLTASVLAHLKNAPILLSKLDSIDDKTLDEIKRRKPTEVIIVGGNQAVSDCVIDKIDEKIEGIKTTRIYGCDRYQTAIRVGEEVRKLVSTNRTSKNSLSISDRTSKNPVSTIDTIFTNDELSSNICSKLSTDSSLNNIILVVGTNFPDAMSVTSLAEYTNTPILLTMTDDLNRDTKNALKSWGISNVIIIGEKNAISKNVEDKIKKIYISSKNKENMLQRRDVAEDKNKSINTIDKDKNKSIDIVEEDRKKTISTIEVDRIGGSDRYETAKLIGDKLISILSKSNFSSSKSSSDIENLSNKYNEKVVRKLNKESIDNTLDMNEKSYSNTIAQAILVDGTDFADALTVSSFAGYYKVPVLLTEPKHLNKTTQNALKDWKISKVTIAGETNAVSKDIELELRKNILKSMVIDRFGGKDRYETAVKISQKYSEFK
ncbi:MAG: BspA family leucine-rich repeat surface protein [Clostridioides sp.]|jgi:surface protein|nr:BspA family leucine-rich repeat surface protein [Clostridioides sp.]